MVLDSTANVKATTGNPPVAASTLGFHVKQWGSNFFKTACWAVAGMPAVGFLAGAALLWAGAAPSLPAGGPPLATAGGAADADAAERDKWIDLFCVCRVVGSSWGVKRKRCVMTGDDQTSLWWPDPCKGGRTDRLKRGYPYYTLKADVRNGQNPGMEVFASKSEQERNCTSIQVKKKKAVKFLRNHLKKKKYDPHACENFLRPVGLFRLPPHSTIIVKSTPCLPEGL
eukprot:scaffold2830_cov173-Amphora_coffeaeformis.AAC.7